jgi:hypothetical protein
LRLNRMAWLGLAVGLYLLPSAVIAQTAATRTTLSVNASGQPTVTVIDLNDGSPASGVVSFEENGRILGQSILNAQGQATANLSLPSGSHTLQASYAGDAIHQSSASLQATVQPQAAITGAPGFQLSLAAVSPSSLPMTLTAGQTGSLSITVIPVNNAALTGPMFVTLSCSGLPSLSSCSFAPENVEILATTPASCAAGSPVTACPPSSLMVVSTQTAAPGGAASSRPNSPVVWAFLLPGVLGLGGFAWGARRRRWLQRIALVALIGIVSVLGATGCSPLYRYYNHGPILAGQTPTGNYTVNITAQSSNGVISTTSPPATFVLTVN